VRFFGLLLPVAWLWDQANRFFNRFDQEDMISELYVVLLMAGAMVLAFNQRACFFDDLLPREGNATHTRGGWRAGGALEAGAPPLLTPEPGAHCAYFAAAFGCCRATQTVLTLYVGCFVRLARPLVWRELAMWVVAGPALGMLAARTRFLGPWYVELLMLTILVVDMFVSLGPELAPKRMRALNVGVALDAQYTIMRYERMIIIAIGSICANATSRAFASAQAFDWSILAMCAATPWAAFLIKVFYFDCCQLDDDDSLVHSESAPSASSGPLEVLAQQIANANLSNSGSGGKTRSVHATELSAARALVWSFLHLPLIGCILWVSVSLSQLVGVIAIAPASSSAAHPHPHPPAAPPPPLLSLSSGPPPLPMTPTPEAEGPVPWHLCAAFAAFIGIGTLQQVLHRGSGRGTRKLGKKRRIVLRLLGIAALCVAQLPLALVAPSRLRGGVTVAVVLSGLTAIAALELAALRRRSIVIEQSDADGRAAPAEPEDTPYSISPLPRGEPRRIHTPQMRGFPSRAPAVPVGIPEAHRAD
jgi:low temperature requirement protein LtrA